MDVMETEDAFVPVEEFNIQGQTSDSFQKFMYELFAKNGIINDLRAYLRGHIVNVLKSAETGNLPACQKHFTQRLELPLQALNILIVEYLLTMEFNYTLSVFISEIPLANMVFEFTKTLLNLDTEFNMSNLQFEDGDVWSILNYIGVKCSSQHALKIVEIYKSEKQPLLWCILKCVSMCQKEEEHISDYSTLTQSSDTLYGRTQDSHRHISNCKHFIYCQACQNKVARLKEKYKRKKTMMEKKKRSRVKKVNVETFMNNMSGLEQTLIDEMFQQLKTAYEAEVEIVKQEQQKKVKQSIANHTLQLQNYREKMEQSFKAREEELSKAIQQRKRFLWGLARSLRDQHEHLARAMSDVRRHTERLTHQERSLKTQLEEAELKLKKRGEDMRNQISEELVMMEGHLENMKKERDRINEERKEIENLKNNDKPVEQVLRPEYDFIKTELAILRKYIEPKCVLEGRSVTDFGIKCFMNNENIGIKKEKLETNRVINDFKKHNNINFSQANLDEMNNTLEQPSTDSIVEDARGMRDDTGDIRNGDVVDRAVLDVSNIYIQDRHLQLGEIEDEAPGDTRGRGSDEATLRQENDRLKNFARQQREYIQALFNEKDRLQRVLIDRSRPRTAPLVSNYLRERGGLPDARAPCPRGSAAGSATGTETRRWWMRRASGATLPLRTRDDTTDIVNDIDIRRAEEIYQPNTSNITQRTNQQRVSEDGKVREKSPKLCLREFKEKLRSNLLKQKPPKASDNNSDAMLREARRRLRMLEIEAEAVEKSYQDFRNRQSEMREKRENTGHGRDNPIRYNLGVKLKPFENYENKTTYEKNLPSSYSKESPETMNNDFDKYVKEYTAKLDLSQTRFANKNSVIKNVEPIPAPFSNKKEVNYLETPLMEFRKLYQGQRTIQNKKILKDVQNEQGNSVCIIKSQRDPNFINKTSPKQQLTIQTNDSTDTSTNNNIDVTNNSNEIDNSKTNLLMVEVENGCDNVVVPKENEGMLIVVESSVLNRDVSDVEGQPISTNMTILVSPKNTGGSKEFGSPLNESRIPSPQSSLRAALKPLFNTSNKEVSSVDLHLELAKENESISEVEKNQDDYFDDFLADVDNYNSQSEYGNNTSISLPKTAEDELFWES